MPTLSVTIPTAAVPRIKAALRQFFPQGLNPETGQPYPEPSNAEYMAQLKEFVKDYIKREVRDYERRVAAQEAENAVTDIDIQD
jgi:hypothetical protein